MSRQNAFFIVAMTLLGLAAVALYVPVTVRDVPPAAPLWSIPASLGGWIGSQGTPRDVIAPAPGAGGQVLLTFTNGESSLWAAVDYYPSQAPGRRPGTRGLLFPGHGWTELSERTVHVPLSSPAGGSLAANLVTTRIGDRRLATLYWYQVRGRSIASDQWYRAVLLYNHLVHGRTDGALVRLTWVLGSNGQSEGLGPKQLAFIQALYPELLRTLPR